MAEELTIDDLRRRVDDLDERLVKLLNERTSCAREVGRLKQMLGMEIYQPDREAEVLRHVKAVSASIGGILEAEAIGRVFERIIDEARRIERHMAERETPAARQAARPAKR